MLHFLASESHWKNIWYCQQVCFVSKKHADRLSQVDVSVKQSTMKGDQKKPKPNLNHFNLKAYLCSTIHRFRVTIRDPWQACSIQSTYLSCNIWAWIWWSGRHPTWHHDKINSILRSTQGRTSLSVPVSLSTLSINCGLQRWPYNSTVNTDNGKHQSARAEQANSNLGERETCSMHSPAWIICYSQWWLFGDIGGNIYCWNSQDLWTPQTNFTNDQQVSTAFLTAAKHLVF